jgi:hypothetical protein
MWLLNISSCFSVEHGTTIRVRVLRVRQGAHNMHKSNTNNFQGTKIIIDNLSQVLMGGQWYTPVFGLIAYCATVCVLKGYQFILA